jgi:hypothetical protein
MNWLVGFLLAVVLPLVLSEFTDWCPSLAKRLVRRAVQRLPQEARARWEQEWIGDLGALEGRRLSQLVRAVWIYLRAGSWGRLLRGLPPISQVLLGRIRTLTQRLEKERPVQVSVRYTGGRRTDKLFEEFLTPAQASMVRITKAKRDLCVMTISSHHGGEYLITGHAKDLQTLLQWLTHDDGEPGRTQADQSS